jgi:predicted DNA-binding antitoxin AbrB/MazE fold protein
MAATGDNQAASTQKLNLKVGEWVEVRSPEEILATLDERSCLDNMPFMPEMLRLSGQRFRVGKRADKTCDPAHAPWSLRRLTDSVHLDGVRCDGGGHDNCEAGCLIFWKEAWLKRAPEGWVVPESALTRQPADATQPQDLVPVDRILNASRRATPEGEPAFFCQGTEVRNFTSFMKWWDIRQDIRDFRSGNLASGLACKTGPERFLDVALAILYVIRSILIYIVHARRGVYFPPLVGTLEKTPVEFLNLQPGEIVQVKSKEEIEATLDKSHRNRGLLFDREQVPYCGGIYRVLRRVNHIIDERTGKMMNMKYPCIVLEGVVCKSDFHRICPRAIYSYWRENWLTRVIPPASSTTEQNSEVGACRK